MPTWIYKLDLKDVFGNEDMTFEERRDEIVKRLRESAWYKSHREGAWFHSLIEELSETEDVQYFDCVWENVYDQADFDRAWIATT